MMANDRFWTKAAGAATLMLALASVASADCEVHEPTPAQKQYYARTYEALKAALPAPPASWTLSVDNVPGLDALCEGGLGFEVSVHAFYKYQAGKEEQARTDAERKKIGAEINALRELPPEVKKERQVWLDKMSVANRASNAAYKAKDKALAKQKDDEAEEYSRKAREIRDRYWASVQPKIDALEARQKTLNEGFAYVEARLAANELFVHAPDPARGSQITAGKVPSARTGGLKLQGVRLVLEGPASRRALIEAAVDRKKLESLVK